MRSWKIKTAGENSSFKDLKMSKTWVLDLLLGSRQQVDAHGPMQMVLEEDMWLSEGKHEIKFGLA